MASQKHPSPTDGKSALGRATSPLRPAVFLDRDGTLIEEREYLSEPSEIKLIQGATGALRRLRQAGFVLVVVTNQSAVGRGWLTETKLGEIHAELERQLSLENVKLDAIYFCPDVAPKPAAGPGADAGAGNPQVDRKPGAGMLFRAARELNLDLGTSWMVGDHARDLAAGRNAGCRGNLLVLTGHGRTFRKDVQSERLEDSVCQDLVEAAQRILESEPIA